MMDMMTGRIAKSTTVTYGVLALMSIHMCKIQLIRQQRRMLLGNVR